MQVDPIKPKLKAPGTKHLKLNCAIPLSTFAFKCNLRRYTLVVTAGVDRVEDRKVWLRLEVRDGPPPPPHASGGEDGSGGDGGGGGGGAADMGTVFARGSALFIVLAKD